MSLKVAGWKVEKLGDVIQKTETINPTQTPNKEFIYIDVSSVNNKTLSVEETSLIKGKDAPSRARKLIKTGDVIFATVRPTLKRIAIISEEYDQQVCSTGYFVLRAKEYISNKFLFYYLQTDSFNERMEKLQKGASYSAVTDTEVREQIIAYPPLPEQQRIVHLLDEAFESIAGAKVNAERNLVNARELFESVLAEEFESPRKNWEICALDKYIKFIDYRGHTPTKTPSGMRLITAKNVKLGFLQRTPEEFVDPKIYDKWMVRGFPVKGDVLFTTEAPLANIAQLDTDEKVLFAQRIIILQPQQEKIDQTFLKYLLLSRPIRKRIFSKATGATVQGIKARFLKPIEIYFPPLAEQRAIVAKLDVLSAETKKLEGIYQSKLEGLEELKKSVLARAFEGEM